MIMTIVGGVSLIVGVVGLLFIYLKIAKSLKSQQALWESQKLKKLETLNKVIS